MTDNPETSKPAAHGSVVSPTWSVDSGSPTPEELAAVVAVLAARAATAGGLAAATRPASAWTARPSLVRRPLFRGPAAWRLGSWQH